MIPNRGLVRPRRESAGGDERRTLEGRGAGLDNSLTSCHSDAMPRDDAPPTLSAKERVVLELLSAKGDCMYGLELVTQSGSRLKRGTVYVTLGRMQRKGLVAAEPEKFADDSGLVPRRMYRATPYGLRVLRVWTVAARSLVWEVAS